MYATSLLAFAVQISLACSANLLFLNGLASPSHHLWNRVLMEELASTGHNLTIVDVDVDEKPRFSNMHYIHLELAYSTIYSGMKPFSLFDMANANAYEAIFSYYEFLEANCKGIMNSNGLQLILNYPSTFKFDAVVYDASNTVCLIPLLHKFNSPPLISVSAFNIPPHTPALVGGLKYPAYIPLFSTSFGVDMNFFERAYNLFLYTVLESYRKYIFIPAINEDWKRLGMIKDLPPVEELEARTALMLVNADYSTDYPEPAQPNMVLIGGMQIKTPKPLSPEINDFIDSGKKGTVLMSLGTNMKSSMLGDKVLIEILRTFEQLPEYNFLWKFETDVLPMALPRNVKTSAFIPQNDILAHKNVKAFITHGGLLSAQEAFWYGVPMIGVPFFVDQHKNVANALRLGVAERQYFQTLTSESFKAVILSVLEKPKFTENAKIIAKRFRDQPQKPLDRAVWWVEYILRNPNPTHLQSPTIALGWFASSSYDVLLVAVVTLALILAMSYKGLMAIGSRLKYSKTKKNN